MHHRDPLRLHIEAGNQVVGSLPADGNDVGGAGHAGLTEARQVEPLEGRQPLWRVHKGQVMHGDHARTPQRQRQHVDQAMHQVGAQRGCLAGQPALLPGNARQRRLQWPP